MECLQPVYTLQIYNQLHTPASMSKSYHKLNTAKTEILIFPFKLLHP